MSVAGGDFNSDGIADLLVGNDTALGGDGNDYFEVRESGDVFVEQALEGSADNIGI